MHFLERNYNMKKKNNLKRLIALGITTVIATQNMSMILANASEENSFDCGELKITYTVTGEWNSHQNIQMCISNPTDSPISRWAFQYDAGGTISDIWNASIVESNENIYVIENNNCNNYIAPHSFQIIGYTVEYNDITPEITEFKNCINRTDSENDDFKVSSYITGDSPESGNGVISITNTSETPIYGWNLSFSSDVSINNCYHGNLSNKNENDYIISCADWNSIILPGSTIELGVAADFIENPDFQINDVKLSSDVLSYSFEDNSDSLLKIRGFSEYGVNVISWDYDSNVSFDVYRQSNDDFNFIGNTEHSMYYLDTEAEPGTKYSYYVTANEGDNFIRSNTVKINTTDVPSDEEFDEPQWFIDMILLEEDCSELTIDYATGDSSNYVSKQLILPSTGINGSNVSWKSNNPQIIGESGNVNAPYSNDFTPVTLTAILSYENFCITKSFELSVAPKSNIENNEQVTIEDLRNLNDGEMPKMTYSLVNGNVSEIVGKCSSISVFNADSAVAVLSSLANVLGITEPETQLEFIYYQKDLVNNVFYFRQIYKGLPVIGYTVSVFSDISTGTVIHINNQFHPQLKLDTVIPEITAEDAIDISTKFNPEITRKPELVVYYPLVENGISEPKLAWQVNVNSVYVSEVFIDALTGEILETSIAQEAVETYSEKNTLLNKDITINTESRIINKNFFKKTYEYTLHDTKRGLKIYDASNQIEESNWLEYIRSDNDWSDESYDTALAAGYNVAVSYDYFKEKFTWVGFDNNNGNTEMKIGIDYAEKKDDGTIDTTVSNAYSSAERLGFGSGNGESTKSYAASLDCVAHEFTHSVTLSKFKNAFGSNMPYEGESGAINEAYSDIFGEFVDPKYDWLHGTEYNKSGMASRNLTSPLRKHYHGPAWSDTSLLDNDRGGVHENCTVISYAAYLMTRDDSSTGLSGIPKDDLEKIWFLSYSYYSSRFPTFLKCRDAVENAVDRLYGSTSDYAKKVRSCFDAVDIQTSDITIRVEDALTNNAVENAKITFTSPFYTYKADGDSICYGTTDNHGEAHFSDIVNNGDFTIKVSHNSYEPLNYSTVANTSVRYYTLSLETPYTKTLKGTVTIADSDTNMTNNVPLSDCSLKLTKQTGSGILKDPDNFIKTTTDANGKYEFKNIPSGRYELCISKSGYIDTYQTINVKNSITTYNISIELIPKTYSGSGYASGHITDAQTGEKVPNLTLGIYSGIHIGTDKPSDDLLVFKLQTDINGKYLTDALDAGNYTVFVFDQRESVDDSMRYLTTSFPIKVLGGKIIAEQNGTVSHTLNSDQLRIVLTWGSTPSDLDSHTVIRSKNGTELYEVYYSSKEYRVDGKVATDLDIDDTSSYGPETTTIYIPADNEYVFYVHDYTNKNAGLSNTALSNSGARVYVYTGNSNTPIEVYSVPSGNGTYWKVFSYNAATHEITAYNTLSSNKN